MAHAPRFKIMPDSTEKAPVMSALWWRDRLDRRDRDEAGLSLIEVMVSMIVFALAASGVVALLITSLTTSRTNRQRVQATQVAAKEISNLRNAVKAGVTIPVGQATVTTSTYQGTTYTVKTTAQWTSLGQQGDACAGGLGGSVAYQRLHTVVTWSTMGSTKPIVSDSIITPPAGQLTNNAINIPVRIVDAASLPQAGLPVSVTWANGTVNTGTTDANGCVLFAQLPPAVYTLKINVVGYVDKDGVVAHQQTVGQTIAGTVPLTTVFYDKPGNLVLVPSATNALPTAYQLSMGQSSWTTNPTSVAGNGLSSYSVAVFPFTSATGSAYSAWTGNCNDSSQSSPSVYVTSGSTKTLTVPFANVTGNFSYTKSGTTSLAKGVTITATSTSACNTSYTWTGVTDNSGNYSFAIPYGQYRFSATISSVVYKSAATGSSPQGPVSITPTTTGFSTVMI